MQLSATGANAACDGLCGTPCDSGADIIFHTSGDGEVAICDLNSDGFGAAASGVATMSTGSAVQDTTTTAGTIDHAHIRNSSDTILTQHTCGVGSGEIQFSSLTFGNNETLTVTSLTITFTNSALT